MECWEHLKCSDGVRSNCPAFPENGKACWKVTGTMCDSGRMRKATVIEKVEFCRRCDFYINYAEKF